MHEWRNRYTRQSQNLVFSRFESGLVYLCAGGGTLVYTPVSESGFCEFESRPAYCGGMAELVRHPAATRDTLRRTQVRALFPPLLEGESGSAPGACLENSAYREVWGSSPPPSVLELWVGARMVKGPGCRPGATC